MTDTRKQAGFTLIEIMVVIVILGLMATLVVQSLDGRTEQAAQTAVRNDISTLEGAIKFYKLDNFNYPSQSQGLQALLSNPGGLKNWRGPYIERNRLPQDPWGNDYRYRYPSTKGQKFDVFSYGADNTEGGDGQNADIGNWSL